MSDTVVFHGVKLGKRKTLAGVGIAKFLGEVLDVPIVDWGDVWEAHLAAHGQPRTILLVNSPTAFSEWRWELAEAWHAAERRIFVQNDYLLLPPSQTMRVYERHGGAGRPPMEVWSTVPHKATKYLNWNVLGWPAQPPQRSTPLGTGGLVYWGSARPERREQLQRYLDGTVPCDVSCSGTAARWYREHTRITRKKAFSPDLLSRLVKYGATIYLEDEYSHRYYTSPATRFYEALAAGLAIFFDEEALPTMRLAGYDAGPYAISTAHDLQRLVANAPDVAMEQAAQWDADFRGDLAEEVRKALASPQPPESLAPTYSGAWPEIDHYIPASELWRTIRVPPRPKRKPKPAPAAAAAYTGRDRSGYEQAPPNCIQFELTEGCSIACSFCGINGIREKPGSFKHVSAETVVSFAKQLDELHYLAGWNPRLELAMHGEPTMHPEYAAIVELLRRYLPWAHIMMTSNATGLNKKPGPVANVRQLRNAGLNVLAIDCYQHSTHLWYPVLEALEGVDDLEVHHYPTETEFNPHKRRTPSEFDIVAIADISVSTTGNHNHLSNHAGAAAPKDDKRQGERCANPFRELAVRWDGNIAMCCNDWRGEAKIGNVNEAGLERVWHDPAMYAWRRALYHGQRTYGPCAGCTHRTFRNGLLPDKFGKLSLPEPDVYDIAAMRAALAGPAYTAPVLRPWELPVLTGK